MDLNIFSFYNANQIRHENNRLGAGVTPTPLVLRAHFSRFAQIPLSFPLVAPATQATNVKVMSSNPIHSLKKIERAYLKLTLLHKMQGSLFDLIVFVYF